MQESKDAVAKGQTTEKYAHTESDVRSSMTPRLQSSSREIRFMKLKHCIYTEDKAVHAQ